MEMDRRGREERDRTWDGQRAVALDKYCMSVEGNRLARFKRSRTRLIRSHWGLYILTVILRVRYYEGKYRKYHRKGRIGTFHLKTIQRERQAGRQIGKESAKIDYKRKTNLPN